MGCSNSKDGAAGPAAGVGHSSSPGDASKTNGGAPAGAGGGGGDTKNMAPSRRRLSVVATDKTGDASATKPDMSKRKGIGLDGTGATRRRRLSQVMAKDTELASVPFGVDAVGVPGGSAYDGLPIVYGTYSRPGNDPMKNAKENQDNLTVREGFCGSNDQMFVAVFDGHGPNGGGASRFVRDELPKHIEGALGKLAEDPFVALNEACIVTNQKLATSHHDVYVSGSTGIMAFIKGNVVYVANIGDSRCILGRTNASGELKALDLSNDQKPDRPDEQARIVASGGRVFEWGVPRVWLKDVDMPGLAMSRSFGDLAAESVGVYAEPELSQVTLGAGVDRIMVLCSDGVVEFLTSQEVIDIALPFLERPAPEGSARRAADPDAKGDPQGACEALVQESLRRWNDEEDVVDDITVIVCFLNYT